MKFNFRIGSLMPAHIINCYLITFISAAHTYIHTYRHNSTVYGTRYLVCLVPENGPHVQTSNIFRLVITHTQVHNGFIKYSYWSYSSHNNPSCSFLISFSSSIACMYDCMCMYNMYDCMYVCMIVCMYVWVLVCIVWKFQDYSYRKKYLIMYIAKYTHFLFFLSNK